MKLKFHHNRAMHCGSNRVGLNGAVVTELGAVTGDASIGPGVNLCVIVGAGNRHGVNHGKGGGQVRGGRRTREARGLRQNIHTPGTRGINEGEVAGGKRLWGGRRSGVLSLHGTDPRAEGVENHEGG